eukprot:307571-Prorocentrum_lima.AAC.1
MRWQKIIQGIRPMTISEARKHPSFTENGTQSRGQYLKHVWAALQATAKRVQAAMAVGQDTTTLKEE